MSSRLQQAFDHALKGAHAGNSDAQLYVAVALLNGLGVPVYQARAAEWCRIAAEQGNLRAQLLLGYLLRKGIGLTKDDTRAEMWFTRAFRHIRENSEVQQAAIRYAGLHKLHEDETGTLFRYRSIFGSKTWVRVRNSTREPDGTYKYFFIQVPPNIEFAREAVAWTFAMHEDDYQPAAES